MTYTVLSCAGCEQKAQNTSPVVWHRNGAKSLFPPTVCLEFLPLDKSVFTLVQEPSFAAIVTTCCCWKPSLPRVSSLSSVSSFVSRLCACFYSIYVTVSQSWRSSLQFMFPALEINPASSGLGFSLPYCRGWAIHFLKGPQTAFEGQIDLGFGLGVGN